jgi:hypothetical protein
MKTDQTSARTHGSAEGSETKAVPRAAQLPHSAEGARVLESTNMPSVGVGGVLTTCNCADCDHEKAAMSAIPPTANRCNAMTKKVWHTPEPQPCKLPAWRDGFCRKHHPANRGKRGDVTNEIAACKVMVTRAVDRLRRVKKRLAELEREQQKWFAFLGGGGAEHKRDDCNEAAGGGVSSLERGARRNDEAQRLPETARAPREGGPGE